jgi:predicted permease
VARLRRGGKPGTPRRRADAGLSQQPGPGRPFRLEVGAKRVEREVDTEIEFHIDMRTRKLIKSGLTPAAAREEALRQFGDLSSVRTQCLTINHQRERAMTRANHLANLRQDAEFGVRTLRKNKGFAAVMLLILALGIGANTAMFTLIDALLLRTLPVPEPASLVTIGDPARTGSLSQGTPRSDLFSYPLYKDIRDQNRSLTGIYASGRSARLDVFVPAPAGTAPAAGGEAEHPRGRLVSGNYFEILGIPAAVGRVFTQAEDQAPGRDPVAVISQGYWQRRFAGDRAAIGRTISVNGTGLTIIGVTPPGFTGDIVGQPIDIWMPLMMQPSVNPNTAWLGDRDISWLLLMGRLRPGTSLARAKSDIEAVATRSLKENIPPADLGAVERRLREDPIRVEAGAKGFSYYRDSYGKSLLTLMVAVGLVLLVVCANVANLMLARAVARGREMSLRMALGAGRIRLIQQLITESVLLAIGGGAVGLLVAVWGSTALLKLAGGGPQPIPLAVHLDGRILGFTALLSLVTAVLFGVIPAFRATRVELATALRTQGRSVAGGPGRPGRMAIGKLLVVAQVALSLLLLVGTGMLLRSMQRLQAADVGAARDQLVIASIDAQRSGYAGPKLEALLHDLTERVGRVPGVVSVAASENGLFTGTESGTTIQVEGFVARTDEDTLVAYDDVGARYFATIGARLLQGRDFEERDNKTGAKVAVINQTAARFFFPAGSPLGHHISMDSSSFEIVGVTADVQQSSIRADPERRVYFPMVQMRELPTGFRLQIRTSGDPARLTLPIRRAILAADLSLILTGVDPLADLTRDSISQDRMVAKVVAFFGGLTLVLAAVGLYGVMAHSTTRRTTEFGLRMALGAKPGDVTRMVLRESLVLVIGGVALGLPAAILAMKLVQTQLFGVKLLDPPSIGFAIAVLAVSAAGAGYLPARRAARVAPLEAIRAD